MCPFCAHTCLQAIKKAIPIQAWKELVALPETIKELTHRVGGGLIGHKVVVDEQVDPLKAESGDRLGLTGEPL